MHFVQESCLPLSFCSNSYGNFTLAQDCRKSEVGNINALYRKEIRLACRLPGNLELMKQFHSIWHLAEIMFIQRQVDPAAFSYKLTNWLNENFPLESLNVLTELEALLNPREDARMWKMIQKLVIRGHFDAIKGLLDEKYESDKLLLETIALKPSRSDYSSSSEFAKSWHLWFEKSKFILENRLRQSCTSESEFQHFESIYKILTGNISFIVSTSGTGDGWKEALIALVQYTSPFSDFQTVKSLTEKHFPDSWKSSPSLVLDEIFYSLLTLDLSKFVRLCSHVNIWLLAHLFDIFCISGVAESEIGSELTGKLREDFIIRYAEDLLASEDTWHLAFSYLDMCRERGRELLSQVAPRLYWNTGSRKTLNKIRFLCSKFNLPECDREIQNIVARSYFDKGMFGPCLWYYLNSGNEERVKVVIEHFCLKKLKGECNFSESIILGISPDHVMRSENLQFLRNFCLLFDYLADKEYYQAGQCILDLMLSNASKEFWPYLLKESVVLLEARDLVFSTDDTFELLRCLDEVEKRRMNPKSMSETSLNVIRLALLRNMARANLAV